MARSANPTDRVFVVVLVVSLALALLPLRWLGFTNDLAAIVKVPVTPLSDLGTITAGWLRPAPRRAVALENAQLDQLQENVELYKQLYLAAEQRARELEEKLRQAGK